MADKWAQYETPAPAAPPPGAADKWAQYETPAQPGLLDSARSFAHSVLTPGEAPPASASPFDKSLHSARETITSLATALFPEQVPEGKTLADLPGMHPEAKGIADRLKALALDLPIISQINDIRQGKLAETFGGLAPLALGGGLKAASENPAVVNAAAKTGRVAKAGVVAAAPDMAMGAAGITIGELLSQIPGMGSARFGLDLPGGSRIMTGLGKGFNAARAEMRAPAPAAPAVVPPVAAVPPVVPPVAVAPPVAVPPPVPVSVGNLMRPSAAAPVVQPTAAAPAAPITAGDLMGNGAPVAARTAARMDLMHRLAQAGIDSGTVPATAEVVGDRVVIPAGEAPAAVSAAEAAARTAKATRFVDALRELGITAKQAGKIQSGRLSANQIIAGSEAEVGSAEAEAGRPRWGNIADHLGEQEPSAATQAEIMKQLRRKK